MNETRSGFARLGESTSPQRCGELVEPLKLKQ